VLAAEEALARILAGEFKEKEKLIKSKYTDFFALPPKEKKAATKAFHLELFDIITDAQKACKLASAAAGYAHGAARQDGKNDEKAVQLLLENFTALDELENDFDTLRKWCGMTCLQNETVQAKKKDWDGK
jgi:hypothetical protein